MTDNIGKRGKLGMKRPAGEGGEGGVMERGIINLPSLGAQVLLSSSLTPFPPIPLCAPGCSSLVSYSPQIIKGGKKPLIGC